MPQRGGLIICLLLKFSSSGFKVVEGRLFTATVESEREGEREREASLWLALPKNFYRLTLILHLNTVKNAGVVRQEGNINSLTALGSINVNINVGSV